MFYRSWTLCWQVICSSCLWDSFLLFCLICWELFSCILLNYYGVYYAVCTGYLFVFLPWVACYNSNPFISMCMVRYVLVWCTLGTRTNDMVYSICVLIRDWNQETLRYSLDLMPTCSKNLRILIKCNFSFCKLCLLPYGNYCLLCNFVLRYSAPCKVFSVKFLWFMRVGKVMWDYFPFNGEP